MEPSTSEIHSDTTIIAVIDFTIRHIDCSTKKTQKNLDNDKRGFKHHQSKDISAYYTHFDCFQVDADDRLLMACTNQEHILSIYNIKMSKGRPIKYECPSNIVSTGLRNHHRMGDCKICGATNIKSYLWSNHLHQGQRQQLRSIRNGVFIQKVIKRCTNIINEKCFELLSIYYPKGIKKAQGNEYLEKIQLNLLSGIRHISQQQIELYLNEQELYYQESFQQQASDQERQISKEQMQAQIEQYEDKPKKKWHRDDVQLNNMMIRQEQFQDSSYALSYHLHNDTINFLKEADPVKKLQHIKLIWQSKEYTEMHHLLKNCFVCKEMFTKSIQSYKRCIYCNTRIHFKCFEKMKDCLCLGKFRKKLQSQYLLERLYEEPLKMIGYTLAADIDLTLKSFKPRTSYRQINEQESNIKKLLKNRGFLYTYTAKVPSDLKINPFFEFDPLIFNANSELIHQYELYAQGIYKCPVKLKKISEHNYGIEALQNIPKNVFICEYATDVLPYCYSCCIQTKNMIMLYSEGKNSRYQLMLVPFNCSNWGPLLNCSILVEGKSNHNCMSIRLLIKGIPRVLIYSNRMIKKGEELLYNYNGLYQDYPTDQFEQPDEGNKGMKRQKAKKSKVNKSKGKRSE